VVPGCTGQFPGGLIPKFSLFLGIDTDGSSDEATLGSGQIRSSIQLLLGNNEPIVGSLDEDRTEGCVRPATMTA
jgi:hypothetical protein